MKDVIILGLIMIATLILAIFFSQWLLIRSVPKVIRIFRKHNAVGEQNAKTIEELGLKQKPMLERMFRMRDYKPRVLQFLMRVTIVEMSEDGKLYLDESKLTQTRWKNL